MNSHKRTATRLILTIALTLPALFITGCSSSDSADSTANASPPPTIDKQKMDEKVQKDSQILNSLKK